MAPPSTLHQSAIPSDFDTPFPPLTRSSTLPEGLQARAQSRRADPLHLAPEDAFHASPPRRPTGGYENSVNSAGADLTSQRQRGRKGSSRSRSRRRKRFQKLLWVNQSCTFVSPPYPVAGLITRFRRCRCRRRRRRDTGVFCSAHSLLLMLSLLFMVGLTAYR